MLYRRSMLCLTIRPSTCCRFSLAILVVMAFTLHAHTDPSNWSRHSLTNSWWGKQMPATKEHHLCFSELALRLMMLRKQGTKKHHVEGNTIHQRLRGGMDLDTMLDFDKNAAAGLYDDHGEDLLHDTEEEAAEKAEIGPEWDGHWKPKTSGPYAGLPDRGTEISWRIADWYLDRQGEGHKLRHAKSREHGKKGLQLSQTLKKMPHGSRRERQGANRNRANEIEMELAALSHSILSGTNSGSIMDADMSDVYGRRWYNTPEGKDCLARQERLERYAAINETCAQDAMRIGMAPEDVQEFRDCLREIDTLPDPETGEPVKLWEDSSSSDSYGDNLDWGYETFGNGTVSSIGDMRKKENHKKGMPKVFRDFKWPEDSYRYL